MNNTKYEDMAENYEIIWLMDELKLLCAGVDTHINNVYSASNTLKVYNMIHQQSGETMTNYFHRFKAA